MVLCFYPRILFSNRKLGDCQFGGLAYDGNGDLDRAIAEYDRAIELAPDWAEAHYKLGNAYGVKGDMDRALDVYSRAIELDPDFILAYYDHGSFYS